VVVGVVVVGVVVVGEAVGVAVAGVVGVAVVGEVVGVVSFFNKKWFFKILFDLFRLVWL
jgi:hypothetical protein